MTSAGQPIRVAFCITELDPGGAEKNLVQLVTGLDRTSWDPHVFCLASPGPLVQELQVAEVPVTCLNARRFYHIGVIFRLARLLRRLKPTLLQTFLFHANFIGRLAARMAGVPVVVAGIRVAEKDSPRRLWLDRCTNRWVDCNVCVSRGVAKFSISVAGLSEEKCVVISNGIDLDRFDSAEPADLTELGVPVDSKTILFVGRLAPQKNPLYLLEVAEQLLPLHNDLHLLFVGDGPLRVGLQSWVRDKDLESRIHFAGWRPDVPSLLKAAYCLALTSEWEGMPNAVLEAMAAGIPVVATQVEGTEELIQHGKTGFSLPAEPKDAFRNALADLLAKPSTARSIGIASQLAVSKGFTVQTMVDSYSQLYQDLIRSSRKKAW